MHSFWQIGKVRGEGDFLAQSIWDATQERSAALSQGRHDSDAWCVTVSRGVEDVKKMGAGVSSTWERLGHNQTYQDSGIRLRDENARQ